ncbi:MAG TPA: M14 family zinc carboxypeptidase [Microvirga sp.]|jgi:hypothetical protein
MTILLEARVPRTLDTLLREWARPEHRGARLEAWLFEDEADRRRGEERFASVGVNARLRSAYKPLVHAFLEEIECEGLRQATVVYPVHPEADPRRFLLEAYPLSALLDGVSVVFEPGGPDTAYRVTAECIDNGALDVTVFAPNRLHADPVGRTVLSPTGWLRVTDRPDGAPDVDERLETEVEAVFAAVMNAIEGHDWPVEEPTCERLAIDVTIPGIERSLRVGEEVISTREALHEDLYFSLLDWFRHRAGRSLDDRSIQPGQIVPDIRPSDGDAQVTVALRPHGAPDDPPRPEQDLPRATSALGLYQIHREIAALAGERFEARSRQGRPVRGLHRRGQRPPVVVSAGQHANETSGVVGALRAARLLLADAEADLTLIPVENPDGYALHGQLCETNPRHMHHAARYTALGSDLEYGPEDRRPEYRAREEAFRRSGAKLHVNLHGYPAHEWTRPFTGYLPRSFELWTIPKGFFLILRHHPEWAEHGRSLVTAVARGLAAVPGLVAFNRRQRELCEIYAGGNGYEVIHDIPCLIAEDTRHPVPLTLITEFPDETIEGEAFRFAHTVQMATVLAAEAAHAALLAAEEVA